MPLQHVLLPSLPPPPSAFEWLRGFPYMGLSLVIIHLLMGFSLINHPAIGVPPLLETSIWIHGHCSSWNPTCLTPQKMGKSWLHMVSSCSPSHWWPLRASSPWSKAWEKCRGCAELSTSVGYVALKKCPSLYFPDLSKRLVAGTWHLVQIITMASSCLWTSIKEIGFGITELLLPAGF